MSTERSLSQWLEWQEQIHPSAIELGLDRIAAVHKRLGWERPAPVVITVAGTNGKGSCVAMLESMLRANGTSVGAFTSPHLIRYNERVTVNGDHACDDALIRQFVEIDRARGAIDLTFFEFGALAAMGVMAEAEVDVAILEVGLGGRLDAVNIIDPDVALITSIGLDHQDWLGDSLDQIAVEKAGIMRAGAPVVFGSDRRPPAIKAQAGQVGAELVALGRDYAFQRHTDTWSWRSAGIEHENLPLPALEGAHQVQNAAACIAVLSQLPHQLMPTRTAIDSALQAVMLPGRIQILSRNPLVLLDVAHNVDSVQQLADFLADHPVEGQTLAVFGALADKDPELLARVIRSHIDQWFVAPPASSRAPTKSQLMQWIGAVSEAGACTGFDTLTDAYQNALHKLQASDRLVVFGSFITVEEVLKCRIEKIH